MTISVNSAKVPPDAARPMCLKGGPWPRHPVALCEAQLREEEPVEGLPRISKWLICHSLHIFTLQEVLGRHFFSRDSSSLYSEASKWLFYLRCDSGSLYHPSSRDFELTFTFWNEDDATRLQAIWVYWEQDVAADAGEVPEDELHPDHRLP